MSEFNLRQTAVAPATLDLYIDLFRACFPAAKQYSPTFLTWQYEQNPDGHVVGTDAFAGNQLAATYVCLPCRVVLRGSEVRALLSLNTATHPGHQGKGLFTKLADATYSRAADLGFDVVFGVANQNSIRGFSTKLGFQDVGGLDARIGVGAFPAFKREAVEAAGFRRLWSPQALRWRAANPVNRLIIQRTASSLVNVRGRTQYPGLQVQGLVAVDGGKDDAADKPTVGLGGGSSPGLRLSLGLEPKAFRKAGASVLLPDRLKPSPLRLIYRNLHDAHDRIDADAVLFSFVDFDPY
jgi:GNAT superfamily N-acetyltransferase